MRPVTHRPKHSHRFLPAGFFLLALLCSLSWPLPAAEDDLDLDENELEYVEIDEILSEDENAPRQPLTGKPAKTAEEQAAEAEAIAEEEKEFVNLNEILYGNGAPGQPAAPGAATTPAAERKNMQQEMQSLKDKALQVNRDLFMLEEDLLYPSSTQLSVFVSFDALPYFRLDGVTLKINDRAVGNHLYTEREIKAMNRGAVQRLYTGNLPAGEHELVAIVTGVGPEGRDYKRAVSVDFEKTSGTKYIELKIEGDNLRQQPTFRLKQWE